MKSKQGLSNNGHSQNGQSTSNTLEPWFDHPEWYEIGFDDMTEKEADFFQAAFRKYCPFHVRRVLEPGCGSGRLIREMAHRGYEMTGFDLSQPSLDYLNRELKKQKLKATTHVANMADFKFTGKFDAAYCPINSFRHLTTEADSRSHLQCIANSLRKGGIYILGLHMAPPGCDPYCIERWYGRRGNIHVGTTLRVTASNLKERVERIRISVLVRELASGENSSSGKHAAAKNGASKNGVAKKSSASKNGVASVTAKSRVIGRLRDEFDYRLYSAAQIKQLFNSVPELELLEVYDFWYDLTDPQKLDNELSDAVFILQRR